MVSVLLTGLRRHAVGGGLVGPGTGGVVERTVVTPGASWAPPGFTEPPVRPVRKPVRRVAHRAASGRKAGNAGRRHVPPCADRNGPRAHVAVRATRTPVNTPHERVVRSWGVPLPVVPAVGDSHPRGPPAHPHDDQAGLLAAAPP
jgi:hypothetical protein